MFIVAVNARAHNRCCCAFVVVDQMDPPPFAVIAFLFGRLAPNTLICIHVFLCDPMVHAHCCQLCGLLYVLGTLILYWALRYGASKSEPSVCIRFVYDGPRSICFYFVFDRLAPTTCVYCMCLLHCLATAMFD